MNTISRRWLHCVCSPMFATLLLVVSCSRVTLAFTIPSTSLSATVVTAKVHRETLNARRKVESVSRTSLCAKKREKYNPFGALVSDFASAVMPSRNSPSLLSPDVQQRILAPVEKFTWESIKSKLSSQSTATERKFRDNLRLGYGPPSPLHNVRLYDESNKEEDIRVTFFRDSASWCPYCQKVWIALETKRIPYRVERINMRCYGDKASLFLSMQPSGNIPVAIIDGTVYKESNDILSALETLFPDTPSLLPEGDEERIRFQELLKLERTLFSAWMYWLTGSREPERYKATFLEVLSTVERKLSEARGGGFFMGSRITLADAQFAPFLERMCASLLFFKGFQIRVASGTSTVYPNINKWFDALERLESYQVTKSDYYTHCWDLPPQLGGCTYEEEGEPYEKAINGERSLDGARGSWELPLQKDNGGVEPDWNFCGNEMSARREAVERVCANYENNAKFAARGAGKKGLPPVSASLADPNATPNEVVIPVVDAVLRCIGMALLTDNSKASREMSDLAASLRVDGGEALCDSVIQSIAYLRDRVGVPRDMRLPAARQFRAHLNWALSYVLDA